MAKKIIRTGTTADPTGDSLKNAFVKVNDNFTELYNALGLDADTLNIGAFEFAGSTISTTDSTAIVIDQATTITSNLSVGGDILPQTALGGDLGSSTLPWRSLYVSNNTIYIGGTAVGLNANGNLTVNGSQVTGGSVSSLVNGANTASLGSDGVLTLPEGGVISEGEGFTGSIKLTPAGGANAYQALLIYPTAGGDGDHIHLTAGIGGTTELYLGNDLHYVKLASDGNVRIQADNGVDGAAWTFGTDGSLQIPGDIRSDSNINIDINLSDSTLYRWQFGEDGALTFPNGTVQTTAGGIWPVTNTAGASGPTKVAIGQNAGNVTQGYSALAIGANAGETSQGNSAVAIGEYTGQTTQGDYAVAVGRGAGYTAQGANAVAIGRLAGYTNQANNSIILNATGAQLDQTTANTFTVAPVRNDVANTGQVMFYNTTSKEITYGNVINVAGNITANNLGNISSLNLNGNASAVLYGNGIFAAVAGGSSIVTTGYNVGANTVVLAGAIKVRYNGIGDIELQATSGTIGAYWTGQYITASASTTLESSRSLNTSVWWAIGANVGATGDTIIITLMDTTNGKIYRVTTIVTPTGNCGSIMIETLI